MTGLEKMLADYFVGTGKMKRASVDSQYIEIEYVDTAETKNKLPQKVTQVFVLYKPSLDFSAKIMGVNK